MNGILNIYKSEGMTSFDVVRKVKKIAKCTRVGHTGTLDPLATGVLPVCIGKATKAVELLTCDSKIYRTTLKLGVITDTYDKEGKILEESIVNVEEKEVIEVVNSFKGAQMQKPPIYSAIRVNGKRLYEYAREGKEVEIKEREIFIYDIRILDINLPYVSLEINSSKGTYIRSICYDIGEKLGCGAAMWKLERLSSGAFKKENSISIEELNEENIESNLITMEIAFKELDEIKLNEKFTRLAINGVCIQDKKVSSNLKNDILYRVLSDKDEFIGIGKSIQGGLKIIKLFI